MAKKPLITNILIGSARNSFYAMLLTEVWIGSVFIIEHNTIWHTKKALLAKMKIGFVVRVCKLWKRNTQFFSALNMKWWIESHIALKVYTLSVIFLCWAIQNSRFIPYQQWTFIRTEKFFYEHWTSIFLSCVPT